MLLLALGCSDQDFHFPPAIACGLTNEVSVSDFRHEFTCGLEDENELAVPDSWRAEVVVEDAFGLTTTHILSREGTGETHAIFVLEVELQYGLAPAQALVPPGADVAVHVFAQTEDTERECSDCELGAELPGYIGEFTPRPLQPDGRVLSPQWKGSALSCSGIAGRDLSVFEVGVVAAPDHDSLGNHALFQGESAWFRIRQEPDGKLIADLSGNHAVTLSGRAWVGHPNDIRIRQADGEVQLVVNGWPQDAAPSVDLSGLAYPGERTKGEWGEAYNAELFSAFVLRGDTMSTPVSAYPQPVETGHTFSWSTSWAGSEGSYSAESERNWVEGDSGDYACEVVAGSFYSGAALY